MYPQQPYPGAGYDPNPHKGGWPPQQAGLKRPRVDDGPPFTPTPPMPPPPAAAAGYGGPPPPSQQPQQPTYGGVYGQPPPTGGGAVGGGAYGSLQLQQPPRPAMGPPAPGGGSGGGGGPPGGSAYGSLQQPAPNGGGGPPGGSYGGPYNMAPQPQPQPRGAPPVPPPVTPQMRGQFLRRSLEVLPKETLAKMVGDVALKLGGAAFDAVYDGASLDRLNRRVFLRDVAWATTDALLRDAMRAFGEVAEATVLRDPNTGKSKGQAFVVFEHGEAAHRLLGMPSLFVDGRRVFAQLACLRPNAGAEDGGGAGDSKPGANTTATPAPPSSSSAPQPPPPSASAAGGSEGGRRRSLPGPDPAQIKGAFGVIGGPRPMGEPPPQQPQPQPQAPRPVSPLQRPQPPPPATTTTMDPNSVLARRIFVQGLPFSVDNAQLREAFCRDGEVEDALVVRDAQTKKSRGFGFVTFRDPLVARRLLEGGTGYKMVYDRACKLGPAQEARSGSGSSTTSSSAPSSAGMPPPPPRGQQPPPPSSYPPPPAYYDYVEPERVNGYGPGGGGYQQPPQQGAPPPPYNNAYGQYQPQQAPPPAYGQPLPPPQPYQQAPPQQPAAAVPAFPPPPPPPQGYAPEYRGWV